MNQNYIDTVKTAHKLCKEMKEIYIDNEYGQVPAFLQKFVEYIEFTMQADESIAPFLMKLALVKYRLYFDIRVGPVYDAFNKFTDKYQDKIMGNHPANFDYGSFLTDDLLYLRDIQPDQI